MIELAEQKLTENDLFKESLGEAIKSRKSNEVFF